MGRGLLWGALVLCATSTAAQTPPDLRPGVQEFLLADPALITWEIPNRFSPFEALVNPADTFARYGFATDEAPPTWHARLWARDGDTFTSPYAPALRTNGPTPWDAERQLPTAPVLKWIKGEDDPNARINITLSYPHDGPCRWEAGETRILAPNCATPTPVSIPQAGLAISVRLGASIAAATTLARPRHEVILGLGDSYASGEGNPDQPTKWEPWFTPPEDDTRWLLREIGVADEPLWLDNRCNRSFFSYQSLAALQRASDDPHSLVSFVHLACTGAEIFNGILVPQNAPGRAEDLNRFSQINAAQHVLCRTQLGLDYGPLLASVASEQDLARFAKRSGGLLRPLDEFDVSTRAQRGETSSVEPRSGMLDCPPDQLRAPDHIFLSIGGNDIGFGDLARYFLVPVTVNSALLNRLVMPDLCPDPKYRYGDPDLFVTSHCASRDQTNGYHSGTLIGDPGARSGIQARYALLVNILRTYLEVSARDIAVVQYPDPLRRGIRLPPALPRRAGPGAAFELEAEQTLGAGDAAPPETRSLLDPACTRLLIQPELVYGSAPGLDPLSPWAALSARDPLEITASWAFNLRPNEAVNLLRQIEDLRIALTNVALDEGLTFACAGRDAFVGRGWWEGDRLNLPSHGDVTERWAASGWQPYAYTDTGRAIRTANDSFLTQKDVNGSVHPNLIGHALMAEVLLARLAQP